MKLKSRSKHIQAKSRFDAKHVILKHGCATVNWTAQTHEGELKYLKKCYAVEIVDLFDDGPSNVHTKTEHPDPANNVQSEVQPAGNEPSKEAPNVSKSDDDSDGGDTGTDTGGDGHEDSGKSTPDPGSRRRDSIRAALESLDAMNDDHFTEFGKPTVAAVAAHVPDVKRDEINAAWPEFNRELAKTL